MKIKGDELGRLIREIVQQELREILPGVISEVLSERYLKKVMAEVHRPAPSGLREISVQGEEDDPEETPEILSNETDGIYTKHPLKKEAAKSKNSFDSIFFEGTVPLTEVEEKLEEGVQIPVESPDFKNQKRVWSQLAFGKSKKPETSSSSQEQQLLEQRLAAKRAALEIPVK